MDMLKPGRELDRKVASEVMGWRPDPSGRAYWLTATGEPYYVPVSGGPETMMPGMEPPYSTDIAAAWEVVEKMRAMGKTLMLVSYPDARKECQVSFYVSVADAEMSFGTAPHAICLAALKAVGSE